MRAGDGAARWRGAAALCVLAAVAGLSGCARYGDRVPGAPVAVPAAYAEAGAAANATAARIGRWWERFGDPSLDALVAAALRHNPGLGQALARLRQAEARLRVAGAPLLPTLDASGELSRDKQTGFFGPTTGTNYRYSLAAGYELDLWGKLRNRRKAARFEAGAAREDAKALFLSLTYQVADLYFEARETAARHTLAERRAAVAAEILRRVEARYREGLVDAGEVYRARRDLAAAETARAALAAESAAARHALAVLTGRFPAQLEALPGGPLPAPPPLPAVGLPSDLLVRRPDIEAALLRIRARDAELGAAVADRFPSVNLLATLGESRVDYGAGAVTGPFWRLAADLALPLVDGGRRRAEAARSRAAVAEAFEAYREALLRAAREVEDALARERAEAGHAAAAERDWAAARLAADREANRYRAGLSDWLSLQQARLAALAAESDLAAARRAWLSARLGLVRALGGDWMDETLARAQGTEGDGEYR
ncbi:efflux transporter outer membrane subunit [Dissulfurirhabdus thermomarina]|uniref:Efflux transporter outer membrane subunit n=1 Tax=Dissulfurirhabdus thermomarina TaxID=1765737 RepID=A0A6N9TPD6_DISTH|nr:efflux transporter outer membrane subunit [Dissulfurirhabdus thermomarina]NDY43029.1 efflux transporter outer membrane subunit [Dissulfurirhabdus thermomarina]NMX22912.1 efflux transporter outer membrane subunit [Dissulfurirhabdus thermomarina]